MRVAFYLKQFNIYVHSQRDETYVLTAVPMVYLSRGSREDASRRGSKPWRQHCTDEMSSEVLNLLRRCFARWSDLRCFCLYSYIQRVKKHIISATLCAYIHLQTSVTSC